MHICGGAVIDRLNEDSILKPNVLVSNSEDENIVLRNFDSMDSGTAHGSESINKQAFVSEREEVTTMEVDRVLGVKDEGLSIDLQSMTCSCNDKVLKSDGNFEIEMEYRNKMSYNEPTESADGGDNIVINEDELLKVKGLADTTNNQVILTGLKLNVSNTTKLTFYKK